MGRYEGAPRAIGQLCIPALTPRGSTFVLSLAPGSGKVCDIALFISKTIRAMKIRQTLFLPGGRAMDPGSRFFDTLLVRRPLDRLGRASSPLLTPPFHARLRHTRLPSRK